MPTKAVVYNDAHDVSIEEIDDPTLTSPNDAILEVTQTAICGSDLHMYEGRAGAEPGMAFGHEIMGEISEVGDGVEQLSPGDRVVLPFNVACGYCRNCEEGHYGYCENVESATPGGAYGYVKMGSYQGGQAERVRVPYADHNALKIPDDPANGTPEDFIMLADVFPTGWHGVELADLQPGESVAIFGAGPVGLMAAYSAHLRGASEIYVVDRVESRLELADEHCNATAINFEERDAVEAITDAHGGGVDKGVDAVGYQAIEDGRDGESAYDESRENPSIILNQLIDAVRPTGKIGIVGLYVSDDPDQPDHIGEQGLLRVHLGTAFEKGLRFGMGQCPVKRYNRRLRDMIIAGEAEPGFVISHTTSLDEAPEMYERFDEREEGVTKVLLEP
ncbi:theronine dehydrogenase-like Zn-dependent dehydrogenase [Halovivax ruber XH-70]|uniref:Theronine dehydrogenase-like Zn-dependent dehydrogenase n=1 Tax=Halovivax ruber (strain DSM 18193 / JCM 13892 / XH-70) TaxID=797302 RepID=L0IEP3_HALRX|nr:glutathione-independent formaldehyde dehydrogenase [Halovivax ruber]AGB16696.1 theronine dehydrogenase-like Zn-dependent dehydrogenase [Halovivax ruber XH-70]